MIFEFIFIALCIAVSAYKRDVSSGLLILSLSLVNEIAMLLPIHEFFYHTILIVNYSIFIKLIKIPMVRLALVVLAFYSIIMFALGVVDMTFHTDLTWNLILSFSNLYELVYYSTIILIFAGLAMRGHGGHRSNSTSGNLFSADHNGINYQRVRSKFN